MIMRVDPTTDTVDMVSLPRDLWVPIAGTGESQRINTAYSSDDGRQRLIDTIQQDFGIPINHYIEVDFKGFQGVVDAIGGVPMYFDEPMRDDNSGLEHHRGRVRHPRRRAGAGLRPVPAPRVQGRRAASGSPTPPATSAASPASRSSCAR